jgi:hypothetical protein
LRFYLSPKLGLKNSHRLAPKSQIESLQGNQGDSIDYYYYINKGFASGIEAVRGGYIVTLTKIMTQLHNDYT